MSVLDDLLNKKPQELTITVALDPAIADAFAAARADRDRAQRILAEQPDDADLAAAAADAEDAYTAALASVNGQVVRITFRALAPSELDKLKAEHAPTEQQKRDAQKLRDSEPEWNVDTFPPAIIAAACLRLEGPSGEQAGMSLEDAERLWTSPVFNQSERTEIFHNAVAVQVMTARIGELMRTAS